MAPTPLRDKVLTTLQPIPESTGRIIRPTESSHLRYATVDAIGPEVTLVSAGQTVLLNPALGQAVMSHLLIPQSAIVATVG